VTHSKAAAVLAWWLTGNRRHSGYRRCETLSRQPWRHARPPTGRDRTCQNGRIYWVAI